jgi:hypothetical protein
MIGRQRESRLQYRNTLPDLALKRGEPHKNTCGLSRFYHVYEPHWSNLRLRPSLRTHKSLKTLAEACVSRTHRRQVDLPPAGFEDREDHRTPCASVLRHSQHDQPPAPSTSPSLRESRLGETNDNAKGEDGGDTLELRRSQAFTHEVGATHSRWRFQKRPQSD